MAKRRGSAASDFERLHHLLPRIRERCAQLAQPACQFAQPWQLHDANIFLHDGVYVFLDWAMPPHPPLLLAAHGLREPGEHAQEFKEDSPFRCICATAILNAWGASYDRASLHDSFALARKLWSLTTSAPVPGTNRLRVPLRKNVSAYLPACSTKLSSPTATEVVRWNRTTSDRCCKGSCSLSIPAPVGPIGILCIRYTLEQGCKQPDRRARRCQRRHGLRHDLPPLKSPSSRTCWSKAQVWLRTAAVYCSTLGCAHSSANHTGRRLSPCLLDYLLV